MGAEEREMIFLEIGVHNADFSVNVMAKFPLLNYVGVDPYYYDGDLDERQLTEIGFWQNFNILNVNKNW